MSKNIDLGAKLSDEDLEYISQRPWLVTEAKLLGHDIDDQVAKYEQDRPADGEPQVMGLDQPVGVQEPDDSGDDGDDYDEWTVDDLKEELGKRNLTKSGKHDELVARLREYDEEHPEG